MLLSSTSSSMTFPPLLFSSSPPSRLLLLVDEDERWLELQFRKEIERDKTEKTWQSVSEILRDLNSTFATTAVERNPGFEAEYERGWAEVVGEQRESIDRRLYHRWQNLLVCESRLGHEPLNQRTYNADDFDLAPVVVIMGHKCIKKMSRYRSVKVVANQGIQSSVAFKSYDLRQASHWSKLRYMIFFSCLMFLSINENN
jgi:hypothetical protein